MEENNISEAEKRMVLTQMKKEITEYNIAEANISKTLTSANISQRNFNKTTAQYLQTLVATAEALELRQPTLPNYLIAVSNLNQDLYEYSEIEDSLKSKINELEAEIPNLEKQAEHLQKVWEDLEENYPSERREVDKMLKSLKFNNRKIEQNVTETTLYTEKLAQRGYDEKCSHQNIVSKNNELTELENKCLQLESELQAYQDLPPSIDKAREKLKLKAEELAAKESEFDHYLNSNLNVL